MESHTLEGLEAMAAGRRALDDPAPTQGLFEAPAPDVAPRNLAELVVFAGGVALVAKYALVSPDTVERAARGSQNPTLHTLRRMRRACELLTGRPLTDTRMVDLWAVTIDDRRRRDALRRMGREARQRA